MPRITSPIVRSGGFSVGPPPLFPPSFGLIGFHSDWRSTWTHIVAGKFSNSKYSGLLFYEQSTGYGEFYETDGQGGISFLRSYSNLQNSWTHIVSGPFYQPDRRTGLLFYDQAAGFAAVCDTYDGNLVSVKEYAGWRTSWTHITTVRIPCLAPDGRLSDCPGLVLYDQAAGHIEIHRCKGSGELELVVQQDGWGTSWTHVVGDSVAGGGLLFYDGSTSHGEIYTVVYDDANGYRFGGPAVSPDGLPPATDITAGNFGWFETGFLFYNRASGTGTFVYSDPWGPTIAVSNETYTGWRTSWDIIVSGVFWAADPEDLKFQNGFTGLLFYDRAEGYGEFDFHEPFDATLAGPLDGYVSPASVLPGGTISFYVNSRVGAYGIRIYRQDVEEALMGTIRNIRQFPQPFPVGRLDYRDGPAWPSVGDFVIPEDWPSGLYLARVQTVDWVSPPETTEPTVSARLGVTQIESLVIPFVVRAAVPGSQSKILLYIDDTTYEAYNYWGGRSLYGFAAMGTLFFSAPETGDSRLPRAFSVSFKRPYRHIYELQSGITKWQKWEVPLIRWLARQGIAVELCTATDLHKDWANRAGLLQNYQLLVCVGHHEYWSREMRDNVEDFAAGGGNVIFLSGNVCWWQVRFDPNTERAICYKDSSDPYANTVIATVHWQGRPVCRPETSLTGVSWNVSVDPSAVYLVRQPDHWVFEGLNFVKDSYFGFYMDQDVRKSVLQEGTETDVYQPEQKRDKCQPSSPSNFQTLAEAPGLGSTGDNPGDPKAATMGIFATKGRGQVFTVGTINWSLGLSQDGGWNEIDQITLNVFKQLG